MSSFELIEAFREAADTWGRRIGQTESTDVVHWGVLYTGAMWHYSTIGRADTSGMSKEQIERMPVGQLMGHHTLDQLIDHMKHLVGEQMIDEEFLVISLIRMIDKEFDDLAENYAKNLEKLRREAEDMRARASDPDFMSFMNAAAKERGRDFTEANLEAMAAFLERRGHGSLDELRDRVQARNLWRELTAAVTGDEFLSDWRRRRMSSHLG